jgi:hypothetical protein
MECRAYIFKYKIREGQRVSYAQGNTVPFACLEQKEQVKTKYFWLLIGM